VVVQERSEGVLRGVDRQAIGGGYTAGRGHNNNAGHPDFKKNLNIFIIFVLHEI